MDSKGLKDIPIENMEDESLDVKPYVDSLAQFVMECDTPMTIAIQGDWGSGKTSMMNLIGATINEKYPNMIVPIWFNTWQYSQFNAHDQLGTSLLTRFASEVSGKSDTGERVKRMLGTVAKSLVRNVAFIGTMAVTGSAEGAKDAQQAVDTALQKDFVQSLTDLKEGIIRMTQERLINDKRDRIVVFIDDLDRLVPSRAVDLLEVFKLFLDVPGCVFVLACDYQVIAQGLKEKFGIGDNDLKGKSFFDKIIQLPFSMPVSQYDIRTYSSDLLRKIGISPNDRDLDIYRSLIESSVGLNPRSMKRLFNSFQLITLAAMHKGILKDTEAAKREERQRILLACLCLQTAFEPVYRHLVSKGSALSEADLTDLSGIDPDNAGMFGLLLEEMGGSKGSMSRRLPDFMDAFLSSLQLESDGTEKLTQAELQNLVEMLGFSSITSTAAIGNGKEDSQLARKALKTTFRRICDYANENLLSDLKKLRTRLMLGQIGRSANLYGEIYTERSFLLQGHKVYPGFSFDARSKPGTSMMYMAYGGDRPTEEKIAAMCSFFKETLSTQFPNSFVNSRGQYVLSLTENDASQSFDDQLATFEEASRKCAEVLLPRLAALR